MYRLRRSHRKQTTCTQKHNIKHEKRRAYRCDKKDPRARPPRARPRVWAVARGRAPRRAPRAARAPVVPAPQNKNGPTLVFIKGVAVEGIESQ